MGKIAFIFPGQGAQYSGMGLELCEASPAAAEVFSQADELRPETSQQCFYGGEEILKETRITQPCMFVVELAAAAAMAEAGISPDMSAGFSLGELSALTLSNAVDFATGFRLVCRRGELMQEASEKVRTSMAAVMRLENEVVEQVCSQFDGIYPVNYNCPGQLTVAGLEEKMPEFCAAVKTAGGKAIPLKVSGGFHSPFMSEAAESFAELLKDVDIRKPEITLYANCTGLPYDGDAKHLLSEQIRNPVRWETLIRNMIAEGADTFIELGPGHTLSGFVRKIDKNVHTFNVSDRESLEAAIVGVKGC